MIRSDSDLFVIGWLKCRGEFLKNTKVPRCWYFSDGKIYFPRYVDRSSDNKKSFLLLYVYFLALLCIKEWRKYIYSYAWYVLCMLDLLLKGVRSRREFYTKINTIFFLFWLRLYLRSREEETAQVLVENVLTKLVLTIKTIYCHSLHINTI